MGLAEDLKVLQELREKGEMTESAYATARDAAIRNHSTPSGSFRLGYFIGTRLVPLAILALLILGVVRYSSFKEAQKRAAAMHTLITLTDEIQNVPAASWKGIRYTLPSGGTLEITLQVIRGNPIDIFLTTFDQLETMQKGEWNNVKVYTGFDATKTKTYRRTGVIGPGDYYLVMRDTSLGILSASASDISVKVQLNP